jgi:hypothetical protein
MKPPTTTPDGLITYELPGVGLAVSAAEHNFMLSQWQSEKAALVDVIHNMLIQGGDMSLELQERAEYLLRQAEGKA